MREGEPLILWDWTFSHIPDIWHRVLEHLELTPDERAGLKSLGPSNPLTLAHMIRARRPAFVIPACRPGTS